MPGTCISNEEQDGSLRLLSLRYVHHGTPPIVLDTKQGQKSDEEVIVFYPCLSIAPNYSSWILKRLRKRSTRPVASRIRCCPVKNGWHFEHTSTFRTGLTLSVLKLLPQAQLTVDSI